LTRLHNDTSANNWKRIENGRCFLAESVETVGKGKHRTLVATMMTVMTEMMTETMQMGRKDEGWWWWW